MKTTIEIIIKALAVGIVVASSGYIIYQMIINPSQF